MPVEPTTLPIQRIGPYTTKAFIGGGGFAWVMAARRDGEENQVALKALKPKYAGDKQFTARFLYEAEVAGQIRHPNIIRILDVGQEGEHVWFAMPLLQASLEAQLEGAGSLSEERVIRVARDIAWALAFAHDTGVIHRDIKPSNILFAEDGTGILSDFGVARAVAGYVSTTGKQLVLGTPHYISPEHARGQPLDGRTDIYGLGVTMYRAATGELPFRANDWYELARLHVEEPPAPPRSKKPELSKPLERIILTCLAKDREERYLSAAALANELDTLLGGGRSLRSTTAEFAIGAMRKMFGRKSETG
ncbi:MAG: serine/threonine-protein kinase [Gemmatimonadales bacterium]